MRLSCREKKMNLAWQPGSGSLCQEGNKWGDKRKTGRAEGRIHWGKQEKQWDLGS